jgi:hypothetical protein
MDARCAITRQRIKQTPRITFPHRKLWVPIPAFEFGFNGGPDYLVPIHKPEFKNHKPLDIWAKGTQNASKILFLFCGQNFLCFYFNML